VSLRVVFVKRHFHKTVMSLCLARRACTTEKRRIVENAGKKDGGCMKARQG